MASSSPARQPGPTDGRGPSAPVVVAAFLAFFAALLVLRLADWAGSPEALLGAFFASAGLLALAQWTARGSLGRWGGAFVAVYVLLIATAVALRIVHDLDDFSIVMVGAISLYGGLVLALLGGRVFMGWMTLIGATYLLFVLALLAGNLGYMHESAMERSAATSASAWAAWAQYLGDTVWTPQIRYATLLSFVTSSITVVLALLIGIPAGYVLARRRFWGVTVIDTLLDMPIVLPPLVVGVSLLVLFQTPVGRWINGHSAGGLVFSRTGIVLAQFSVACAFGIRTLKATFQQIDPRIAAVARTLGATRSQAFFRLTLPMAGEGILAAAVMTWARAIGEFGPILIFCGTTRMHTEVLPTSIFLEFSVGNLQAALAVSMLMVLIGMVTLLLFKKIGGIRYV